ncbi:hypothetical protein T492DRAFT_888762, partial [Pavlovales sp. CCMP2436]
MCEYQHAMGNSNGNFGQFWEVVRRVECVQGGFVWDWGDSGSDRLGGRRARARGVDCMGFNINGLVWPDRTPHPGCFEVRWAQQPVRMVLEAWHWRGE